MIGTKNCIYETPCGWCSKWDKECDKKMHKPVESVNDFATITKMCASESDHEWECIAVFTTGTTYRCKKCGVYRGISWLQPSDAFKSNSIPNCCKTCLQHPSNGGSGICNCTAPYFEQGVTITLN